MSANAWLKIWFGSPEDFFLIFGPPLFFPLGKATYLPAHPPKVALLGSFLRVISRLLCTLFVRDHWYYSAGKQEKRFPKIFI